MIRYIPSFILQNYEKNVLKGTFEAYVLLIDIADFTKISTALQKEGKQGAEELSRFLDIAFGKPIEMIKDHGGFVSLFAGDAFCAIFPNAEAEYMISVVNSISSFFREHITHKTPFGEFAMKIRQTICYGDVDWKIYVNELQNEYVFYGEALQELVDLSSLKVDVIFSEPAVSKIGKSNFKKLESGYHLISKNVNYTANPLKFQYTQKTIAKFINPKYRTKNPQNEIRSAAYCFANLERIEFSKREQAIAAIQNLADRYGGFVNKYDATDKGMIAIILFGLPKSEDKTLDRICRFSMEAIETIPLLALGITAGSVYAGYTGSGEVKEYTALGHPMNLAERLMGKAKAGEILTDHYLFLELQQSYEFDLIGSIELKGIDMPLNHYRLTKKTFERSGYQESRFVGREKEIEKIKHIIEDSVSSSTNSIIYVVGDAGIGKSRLVKEVLVSINNDDYHKFFISCDAILQKPLEPIKQMVRSYFSYIYEQSPEEGIRVFRARWIVLAKDDKELLRIESIIASLLSYEWKGSVWDFLPPEERPSQLQKAFIRLIEVIAQDKPILIHLDDAQWIDIQSKEYFQFLSEKEIKPIVIIATCRYLDSGEIPNLELVKHRRIVLDLNTLNKIGSRQLIQSILRVNSIPDSLFSLINNNAMGNPLFIEQLIAYMLENGKLNKKGEIVGDVGYISSFSITDIIGSRIDHLTENMRDCVSNASVLGMQFYVKVLNQMLDHEIADELQMGAQNRIWRDFDELRYIFSHILIKDVVYQRMMSEKLQYLHQTAAEAMEIVFADKFDENAEEIAIHFEKGNLSLQAADYYNKAGCWFSEKCDFERAEVNLNKSLTTRETVLGAEHPDTATSLYNLAYLYQSQGEYDKSEPLYLRALEIREKVLGAENPDTADSMNCLAVLYNDQSRYDKAEPLYLRALKIRMTVLGEEHPDVAQSLNNLACLYLDQCKYEQAEPLQLRALKICESVPGVEHTDIACFLNNLALLYSTQGKYEQAEPLHKRALEICEKKSGVDNLQTAKTLNNMVILYFYQGKYDQAELVCRRALEIKEKVLGIEHPVTAATMNNLAAIHEKQGKYDQAESLYLKTLEIAEELLGAEHHSTAASLSNLSQVYEAQGKYDQAEPLLLRALDILKKVLGIDHPNMAIVLGSLANVYYHQGKYEQAESLFLRTLEIRERVLGIENPYSIQTLEKLVNLYDKTGQVEKAAEYKAKLDKIKKKEG
jgi:predicted ATPase/class 3 adenylate cyclase